MNLRYELEKRISAALAAAGAPDASAMVAPTDPKFGDYKASGVMGAAKKLKLNPRELAQKVVALLQKGASNDLSDLAEKIDIAGPGFINITLRKEWLQERLADLRGDEKLGVSCDAGVSPACVADILSASGEHGADAGGTPATHADKMSASREGETPSPHAGETPASQVSRQTIVVDYSAPNLAKEMHVGHLRSTIIGDALARVLEFQGHNVIRQNHVGDWGTQFGMLTAYLHKKLLEQNPVLTKKPEGESGFEIPDPNKPMPIGMINMDAPIKDLEQFYREAKALFDSDPRFAELSRSFVVRLQSGHPPIKILWKMFLEKSMAHCEEMYERLGVSLTPLDIRGESAYNNDLSNVITDLRSKLEPQGMFKESKGAQCVFLPQFVAKDGTPLPLIVQKSDEGYLYATTDLAAIRYRVKTLHADRVLYVVDARQSLHFQMVFATAHEAKFDVKPGPEDGCVKLEHIAFGTMMGADGKPFKTRTGGTVKLMELLNEAVEKARQLVEKKNAEDVEKGRSQPLSEEQKKTIAEAVGIGAVKYSDLAQNRNSDYVFSWDKMLAMDGNTAPYMQYAYARIKSIFRKERDSGSGIRDSGPAAIELGEPAERALAVKLLQFPETVTTVAVDCLPSVLCAYLYDLAGAFTTFYENCPVLKSEEPLRSSRLALCDLTARTIRKSLELLGISTIEQM